MIEEKGFKHFGWILILLGTMLFINIIVFEILGIGINGSYIYSSFWFLVAGFVILGIDRIILYLRLLIGEMKYFRKHYMEKDNSDETNI